MRNLNHCVFSGGEEEERVGRVNPWNCTVRLRAYRKIPRTRPLRVQDHPPFFGGKVSTKLFFTFSGKLISYANFSFFLYENLRNSSSKLLQPNIVLISRFSFVNSFCPIPVSLLQYHSTKPLRVW